MIDVKAAAPSIHTSVKAGDTVTPASGLTVTEITLETG